MAMGTPLVILLLLFSMEGFEWTQSWCFYFVFLVFLVACSLCCCCCVLVVIGELYRAAGVFLACVGSATVTSVVTGNKFCALHH
jgi:hypothetical protein